MIRAAAFALVLLAAGAARAGDPGPLKLTLVNMTPDAASSAASKACVRKLADRLGSPDGSYMEVTRLGETPLRKALGKPPGEPFIDWPGELLAGLRKKKEIVRPDDEASLAWWPWGLLLVDCRPEEKRLDVLAHPRAGGAIRYQLRGVSLDDKALGVLFDAVQRRIYAGHDP